MQTWYEEQKKGCGDRGVFNGPFGFSVGHLPSSRLRVLILLSYLKLFNAHSFQNKICLKFYSNDRKDNDHNDDQGNTQQLTNTTTMTTTATMITKIKLTITTINLPPKILDNHCFQFLPGITVVLREIEDNGHASFFLEGGWGRGVGVGGGGG